MSQSSPLLDHLYASFRAVFGQPSTMLELDSQWTIRPDSDPLAPAIFVLVNGSYLKPAVWIFDPYDGGDNVWRTAVEAEAQVDWIIEAIKDRLAAAGHSWNSHDQRGSDGGAARGAACDQRPLPLPATSKEEGQHGSQAPNGTEGR